jgi:hypothetical protein
MKTGAAWTAATLNVLVAVTIEHLVIFTPQRIQKTGENPLNDGNCCIRHEYRFWAIPVLRDPAEYPR